MRSAARTLPVLGEISPSLLSPESVVPDPARSCIPPEPESQFPVWLGACTDASLLLLPRQTIFCSSSSHAERVADALDIPSRPRSAARVLAARARIHCCCCCNSLLAPELVPHPPQRSRPVPPSLRLLDLLLIPISSIPSLPPSLIAVCARSALRRVLLCLRHPTRKGGSSTESGRQANHPGAEGDSNPLSSRVFPGRRSPPRPPA